MRSIFRGRRQNAVGVWFSGVGLLCCSEGTMPDENPVFGELQLAMLSGATTDNNAQQSIARSTQEHRANSVQLPRHRRLPPRTPELTPLGTVNGGAGFDEGGAETVAFDRNTARLFVTNVGLRTVDIINLQDPVSPYLAGTIDTSTLGGKANSVAVSSTGVIAVAVEDEDPQAPGLLAFFDADGEPLSQVSVGAMPDMVTFTPNGQYALVANEGEPNEALADPELREDPEGSISVVDLRGGANELTQSNVRTAGFAAFEGKLPSGVRISGPGATVAQDLEPEYIAVDSSSKTAWVTLQENNALAIVDIRKAKVTDIVPLGSKDHSLPGQGLDASDRDEELNSGVNIATYPLSGLYMPDGIASYRRRGATYLVTANEGDAREYGDEDEPPIFTDEAKCGDLLLDANAFPNAEELQDNARLGRLRCVATEGDSDNDGDYDKLVSFGGRSFSIWNAKGELVFDSGDEIEQTLAALEPENFNSNNDENNSFDSRSDNRGPEPEGVVVGRVRGRHFAMIGLERVGGIVVYDVTRPRHPTFLQYLNTRDFSGVAEEGTAGDLAPEGMVFIPAADSPSGKALLAVAYEVSGTTTVYQFD